MKKIITLLAFVAMQTAVFAQGTWKSDKMHSRLQFTVTHLSVSDVDGNFKDFDVTITTTKPDFSDAKFALTAKVASINTGVDMRDDDLRSDHFFNAAVNPELTFTSAQKAGVSFIFASYGFGVVETGQITTINNFVELKQLL